MFADRHGWHGLRAGVHFPVPRLSPALSNGDRYRRIIWCRGDDPVVLKPDFSPNGKAGAGERDSASADRLDVGGLVAVYG